MKTKHTPGPWNYEQPENTKQISGIIRCYNNEPIADLRYTEYEPKSVDQMTANAKLIAAAPELAESLTLAYQLLEEHLPNWYLRGHYNKIIAALTKAGIEI